MEAGMVDTASLLAAVYGIPMVPYTGFLGQ